MSFDTHSLSAGPDLPIPRSERPWARQLAPGRGRRAELALDPGELRRVAQQLVLGARALDRLLERRADLAEGEADALSLGAPLKTLDEEIAELRSSDKVDAELEALKASLAKRSNGGEAEKKEG